MLNAHVCLVMYGCPFYVFVVSDPLYNGLTQFQRNCLHRTLSKIWYILSYNAISLVN